MKAGTLILAMSVLLWFLQSFGFEGGTFGMVSSEESSILGFVGGLLAPPVRPLGLRHLAGGGGPAHRTGGQGDGGLLHEHVLRLFCHCQRCGDCRRPGRHLPKPLAAYSFLVFVLLYVPCVAAVSTIRKEMNSTKWTLASIGWQLGAAWLGSFLVYQLGSLVLRVIGC